MKNILIIVIAIMASMSAYTQQIDSLPALTQHDYLKKSRSQRTVGIVLAAGGSTLATTGLVLALRDLGGLFDPSRDHNNGKIADVLGYAGLIMVVASIPLFISSSVNGKKAKTAAIGFKMQNLPVAPTPHFSSASYPALSLKINL